MSFTRAIFAIAIIFFLLTSMQRCTDIVRSWNDLENGYKVANENECIEKCLEFLEQNNRSKVNPIYIFKVDLGIYKNKTDKVTKIIDKSCKCMIT